MPRDVYDSREWRAVRQRVIDRDGNRCTIGRLIGGGCSATPLHVHHVVPLAEGGPPLDEANLVTTCARHHPMLEALRRRLLRRPRCPHRHPYPQGRVECERRLARSAT